MNYDVVSIASKLVVLETRWRRYVYYLNCCNCECNCHAEYTEGLLFHGQTKNGPVQDPEIASINRAYQLVLSKELLQILLAFP